jgi:acetoacetyl-CoA reductase
MGGRLAYVTGGMGGIGTPICKRLCQEGFRVVAGCGPGSGRKDRWMGEMSAQGFEVHASEGNVADWESTRAAFEKVRNELGPVDILVNNAGITADGTLRSDSSRTPTIGVPTSAAACSAK